MRPPIVVVDDDGHCLIFDSVADIETYLTPDDVAILTSCDADGRTITLRPADRGRVRVSAPRTPLPAPDHLSELLIRALLAAGVHPAIDAPPSDLLAVASRMFGYAPRKQPSLVASLLRRAPRGVELRDVRITRAHDNEAERRAQWQLELLLVEHDVSPWLATPRVVIDERATPHSHPVLTLNARHTRDPLRFLASFLHEQIHWPLATKRGDVRAATAELRRRYPTIAVDPPDGAGDRASSYLHLIVNWLEFVALRDLAGEPAAREVFDFWTRDHYRALYRTVLADFDDLAALLARHQLTPLNQRRPR
jgi:hypothetical protein